METLLVGYGTLLLLGSLGQTIGAVSATAKPVRKVIVRDYRRLFNLRPDHYESSDKLGLAPLECGALNVEPEPGFKLNALAFPVTEAELRELDRRERYYERRFVPLLDFDSEQPVKPGFVYTAAPDSPHIESDPARLLPLWRDVVWTREGSRRLGERFLQVFDTTTYLADGRTLVVDRYRDVLQDTGDVEIPE